MTLSNTKKFGETGGTQKHQGIISILLTYSFKICTFKRISLLT